MQKPLCWNCITDDVTEMPRCFSISIQSEVCLLYTSSTWEHMKLLFFPVFLLTLLQTCTRRAADTCIPAVRAISVFIGLSLIPMLYYTYTGIVGTHALWADIAVFILAAAGTFAADSLLTRSGRLRRPWQQIAGMLALWALAFCVVWCTFRPPQLALWLDPVTGRYGL